MPITRFSSLPHREACPPPLKSSKDCKGGVISGQIGFGVQGAGQGGSHETNGTPGVTHGNPLQSGRTIKDYQNQKRWPFLENEECET